jgi:hypothetical protein
LTSPTLARPDLLVTIDGTAASAEMLDKVLALKKPGDRIVLEYRRSTRRGANLPTAVEHADLVERLEVELADHRRWTGTFGTPGTVEFAWPLPPLGTLAETTNDDPDSFGRALAEGLAEHAALAGELERLRAAQREVVRTSPDARRLARVAAALEEPFLVPDLGAEALATARALLPARPVRAAATLAAMHLDAPLAPFDGHGSAPVPRPQNGIYALDFLLNQARLHLEESLGDRFADPVFARQAIAALGSMRTSLLVGGPEASSIYEVVRAGARPSFGPLIAALAHLETDFDVGDLASAEADPLPEEFTTGPLAGAISGPVLTVQEIRGVGWAVVGGPGPNRYDLAKIAAVFDIGGDDEYVMSDIAPGMRAIIDLGGNDRYRGHELQGIAGGVCGLFVVDDRGGNDRYEGGMLNAGAGLFGVGLLIDRGGDDQYGGDAWSLGAAAWGTGILIDLVGNDRFSSNSFGQGCGGPRGFGAILDAAGDDQYDIDGTRPSEYGLAGTSSSFGQGMGVGMRLTATGGIGLLCDLAGDDRYDAGEFAQGGGYFVALGMLLDRAGNDVYRGNRYAQGFAAHQAAGVLVDDAGDDRYTAVTAAQQGAAWDQSIGVLLDRAGDDRYEGDDLAQGSAAQQALAILLDGGGNDQYRARSDTAQGASGRNEYHWLRPPPIGGVLSWSLFIDLGDAADRDTFSTGRTPGTTLTTGVRNETDPAASTLFGLFIDRPQTTDR